MATSSVENLSSLALVARRAANVQHFPCMVSLFNHHLSEQQLIDLCRSLELMTSIVSVDLGRYEFSFCLIAHPAGSNTLGDTAIGRVCASLVTCSPNLAALNLGGNSITDVGAKSLADLLEQCPVRFHA